MRLLRWKSGDTGCLMLAAMLLCSCATDGLQTPQHSTTAEEENMSTPSHTHHGIDYIEFTVTDMAKSQQFYGAAFDWKFNDYGPDYAGIQKEGGEAGGLRLDSKASTGGPLVILYSKNLDMTFTKVRAAGGRITKEPFDFPGGRRFQFEDPSGNELAVWSEK